MRMIQIINSLQGGCSVRRTERAVRYTDAKGRRIVLCGALYAPAGEGRHPAVILCHGFNGHYTDFTSECANWAESGFVCYAFDFCAAQSNGRSTGRTADEYTPFTMVEDLKAVVSDIKTLERVDGRVFLFGGSQGGLVAALAAADEDVRDGIAALAMYYPAFCIPENWREAPARHTPLMGWSIGAEYIESVRELDPYKVIPEYDGDVCFVTGDRDPIVTGDVIERTAKAYGAGRVNFAVIAGAGHGFTGEAAEIASETVLRFLKAHTD